MKKIELFAVYKAFGLGLTLLALLMLGLAIWIPSDHFPLNWFFYLIMGVCWLNLKKLLTVPHLEWWLAGPAILGIFLVMVKDSSILPVQIDLDMFTIIIYCGAFMAQLPIAKKEKQDD